MTCCFPSWRGGCTTKPPGSQLWSMCKGVILYRFRYIDQFIQRNILYSYHLCIHMTYIPLQRADSRCMSVWPACFSDAFWGEHQNDHIHWFIHLGIHKCLTKPSLLVKLSPGHPPLPKRRFPQLATLAWPDQTQVRKFQKPFVLLTLLNVMKEQHANWVLIDFWSYNNLFLP